MEYAQKGCQLALDLNDIFTIMSNLDTLGFWWLPINHERGREFLLQTLDLTLELNGYRRAGSIYPNLSITLVDIYQLDQAEHIIDDGLKFTPVLILQPACIFPQKRLTITFQPC